MQPTFHEEGTAGDGVPTSTATARSGLGFARITADADSWVAVPRTSSARSGPLLEDHLSDRQGCDCDM